MKRTRMQPAAAGLAVALCVVGGGLATASPSAAGVDPGAVRARAASSGADLVRYANCAQLLLQVKAEALKEVGPYGLPGASGGYLGYPFAGAVPVPTALSANPTAASPPSTAATSGATGAGGQGYSTTNDQEAGVDEPDMVKTNGQVMVVLRQDPLGVQVVDVSGSAPKFDGFLALPQLQQASGLFLAGNNVYVIGGGASAPLPVRYVGAPHPVAKAGSAGGTTTIVPGGPMIPTPLLPRGGYSSTTEVVVVSVASPESPAVVKTFSFQGQEQGARLINGQGVLVLTNEPRLPWVYPLEGTAAAEKVATAANKAVIRNSKAADWLPSETIKTGAGRSAATVTRQVSCARTLHTIIESGLGTVSLVSLGAASGGTGSEVSVIGNAENVYASATQVYVATSNWQDQGWGCAYEAGVAGVACPMEPVRMALPFGLRTTTDIYGFDISKPGAPQYLGSGSVPGTLIGQYAMSEYNGYLRVATTRGEPTPAPADGGTAPPQLSDNLVSVLRPESGSLITVGTLHGLGRGEKIYAVRFVGDLGYVVTFNQTDPLYVVDLSDPVHPALAGQVSLSGYSSFLQPLSNSLLLGIGEAVDQQLRTAGLQLEVFDVAQPRQPALVSRQQLGQGFSSAAEYDPHALLWWPASGLLVLPVDNYSSSVATSAADVWSVSSDGALHQVGSLTQPGNSRSGSPEIERAVVVGSDLYTLSEQGVMVSNMNSLASVAWLAYPNTSS
jgi:uncharacterized secreted protein with C-terminal beta-propeller domain